MQWRFPGRFAFGAAASAQAKVGGWPRGRLTAKVCQPLLTCVHGSDLRNRELVATTASAVPTHRLPLIAKSTLPHTRTGISLPTAELIADYSPPDAHPGQDPEGEKLYAFQENAVARQSASSLAGQDPGPPGQAAPPASPTHRYWIQRPQCELTWWPPWTLAWPTIRTSAPAFTRRTTGRSRISSRAASTQPRAAARQPRTPSSISSRHTTSYVGKSASHHSVGSSK